MRFVRFAGCVLLLLALCSPGLLASGFENTGLGTTARGMGGAFRAVADDWSAAYYTEFTRAGGTRPIIVSYASSPPVEVIYAEEPMDSPPTAAVTSSESCFRQIEFVGILKGTTNRDLAEKWIDFMLSTTFQEDVPLQMFVFPVNSDAKLPDVFTKFTSIPELPAQVNPDEIAANREKWIAEWTETVLR
jgi:thiamine transport system substrate-binding protein